jgi:hypothetical protein
MNKKVFQFSQYISDWDNDIGDISHTITHVIKSDSFQKALLKFIELLKQENEELDIDFKFKELEEYRHLIEI